MFIVVTYDIASDKRRARLRSVLRTYGVPVQESVYECDLTKTEARRMKRKVRATIRRPVDSVRFYPICADCLASIENEVGPVTVETPAAIFPREIPGR